MSPVPDPRRRDPTGRFSDRVEAYVRHRPGYPDAMADAVVTRAGMEPGARVADIGAGTGLSSRLFLDRGFRVVAVEPNRAMREAAESLLDDHPGFRALDGTAEATGLEAGSVDLIVAGQAFHWFDPPKTRLEFLRVLREDGFVALFWNRRLTEETPFLREYEALLLEHGTDYAEVDHRRVDASALSAFFGSPPETLHFENRQELDREGLRGRLLSSSYVPGPREPGHEEMLRALDALFDRHAADGRVTVLYDTELHLGRLVP